MNHSASIKSWFLFVSGAVVMAMGTICMAGAKQNDETDRPNVVFIICDDLNDYIEGFS